MVSDKYSTPGSNDTTQLDSEEVIIGPQPSRAYRFVRDAVRGYVAITLTLGGLMMPLPMGAECYQKLHEGSDLQQAKTELREELRGDDCIEKAVFALFRPALNLGVDLGGVVGRAAERIHQQFDDSPR